MNASDHMLELHSSSQFWLWTIRLRSLINHQTLVIKLGWNRNQNVIKTTETRAAYPWVRPWAGFSTHFGPPAGARRQIAHWRQLRSGAEPGAPWQCETHHVCQMCNVHLAEWFDTDQSDSSETIWQSVVWAKQTVLNTGGWDCMVHGNILLIPSS